MTEKKNGQKLKDQILRRKGGGGIYPNKPQIKLTKTQKSEVKTVQWVIYANIHKCIHYIINYFTYITVWNKQL